MSWAISPFMQLALERHAAFARVADRSLEGCLAIGFRTLRPHRAGFSTTRLGAAVMLR